MGVTDAGQTSLAPSSSKRASTIRSKSPSDAYQSRFGAIGRVPSPNRKRNALTPRIKVETSLRDGEERDLPRAGISLLWKTPLWRAVFVNAAQLFPIAISVPLWNKLSVDQFGSKVYQLTTLDDIIAASVALAVNAAWCQMSSPNSYGRRSLLVFTAILETILLFVLALTQNYTIFFAARCFAYILGGSIPSRVHSAVLAGWVADWCPKQSRVAAISYMQGMTSCFFAVAPLIGGFLLRYVEVSPQNILILAAVCKLAHPVFAWVLMPPLEPRGHRDRENDESADEEVLFSVDNLLPAFKGARKDVSVTCSVPEVHKRRPHFSPDLESGISAPLVKVPPMNLNANGSKPILKKSNVQVNAGDVAAGSSGGESPTETDTLTFYYEKAKSVAGHWLGASSRVANAIWAHHRDLIVIYLSLGIACGANHRARALYVIKELNMPSHYVSYMSSASGVGGFLMQFILIPYSAKVGVKSERLLSYFLFAQVLYFFTMGVTTDHSSIVMLAAFGALTHAAETVLTCVVVQRSNPNQTVDQGAILGGLSASKSVVGVLGPFILSSSIGGSNYLPWPLDQRGAGWIYVGLTTLPAFVVAYQSAERLTKLTSVSCNVVENPHDVKVKIAPLSLEPTDSSVK